MKKRLVYSCLFVVTLVTFLVSSAMAGTPRREVRLEHRLTTVKQDIQGDKKDLAGDQHLIGVTDRMIADDQARIQTQLRTFGPGSAEVKKAEKRLADDREKLRSLDANDRDQKQDIRRDEIKRKADKHKLEQVISTQP
jgi:hypothetical protein